jgi:pyruvate, orthophosphate dikinase
MKLLTRPAVSLAKDVYRIPCDGPTTQAPDREVVGSKAHNLMRLAARQLPVPPAFVLSTDICRRYLREGAAALAGLDEVLQRELHQLTSRTGHQFGDTRRPLLLSVRSGAAISMPGMMETVLNVGLTDTTLRALIRMTGNPRLAADCQRRLVQQYGEVVHEIDPARFARRLTSVLTELGATEIEELDTAGLRQVADAFLSEYAFATGQRFPNDPRAQLNAAIEAVLRSWSSTRAKSYRKLNAISDDLGTAVIVQAMVFGNLSPTSGSGVGFTRNPADGGDHLYVDYLANAQGEDVVAGRRKALGLAELERRTPDAYQALLKARRLLEQEFSDMQDFEFTVEDGRLFLLQSRTGKRTPLAALRIATDLVDEGLITSTQALERLDTIALDSIESVQLKAQAGQVALARGTPASTGVAVGAALFDPERLGILKRRGNPIILVRETAETGDISALSQAEALIAAEGARTSHASVVARQLGKVCVVGCESLRIDASGRSASFGEAKVEEGEILTVDGLSGTIYRGTLEVVKERPTALLAKVEAWRKPDRASAKRRPAKARVQRRTG